MSEYGHDGVSSEFQQEVQQLLNTLESISGGHVERGDAEPLTPSKNDEIHNQCDEAAAKLLLVRDPNTDPRQRRNALEDAFKRLGTMSSLAIKRGEATIVDELHTAVPRFIQAAETEYEYVSGIDRIPEQLRK